MRKHAILVVLVPILLGVALYLGMRGDDEAPAPGEFGATHEPGAEAVAVPDRLAEVAGGRPAEASATTRTATPLGADAGSVPRPELLVRVQDKHTGRPVPGAEVLLLDMAVGPEDPEARAPWLEAVQRDPEEVARRHCNPSLADERGEARVQRPPGEAHLVARAGPLYGHAVLPRSLRLREAFVLVMERDLTLRVQTVDSQGVPRAGVAVLVLRERAANPRTLNVPLEQMNGVPFPGRFESGRPLRTLGTTAGTEGLLEVRHAQRVFTIMGFYGSGPGARGLLAPEVLGSTLPGVAFDLANPPVDPVRLQLPPTASVALLLQDAAGQPLRLQATVTVKDEAGTGATVPQIQRRLEPGEDGVARFPHVVLGARMAFQASVGGTQTPTTNAVAPSRADTHLDVTIRTQAELPVLTFRLVDAEGRALAQRDASVHLRLHEAGNEQFQTRSDAEGRVRALLRSQRVARQLQRGTVELVLAGQGTGLMGSLPAPRDLRSGENDLGDVMVREAEILAAGVVVGSDATPIPSPAIQVALVPPKERPLAGAPPRLLRASPRSHPDGRFVVRGICDEPELRLIASCDGYVASEPITIRRGARDLRVELEKAGLLEGTVRTAPGAANWLRVVLHSPSGKTQEDGVGLNPEGHGAFRFAPLRGGTYSLSVFQPGLKPALVTLDHLLVVSGEACADPRLKPVDLRALVTVLEVAVADADGRPITQGAGEAQFRHNAEEPQGHEAQLQSGVFRVQTPTIPLHALGMVHGYRPFEIPDLRANTTVRLQKNMVVHLDLPLPQLLSGAQVYWQVYFRLRQPSDANLSPRLLAALRGTPYSTSRAPSGRHTTQLPCAGTWELSLEVAVRRPDLGWQNLRTTLGEPIVVRESAEPQTFSATVPEAFVEQLRARLAR